MYKDVMYIYCLSWHTVWILGNSCKFLSFIVVVIIIIVIIIIIIIHANLITLQHLWMLHTWKLYTFCICMILTVSQGGESFAETSINWKIQRVKSKSDLLFALFDIFKIQTRSTKQGNMGLLVDTSNVACSISRQKYNYLFWRLKP